MRGSTHLCSGQEAVTVGACSVLRGGDSMLCTYRGHGAVLAKGAPLDRSFGEILGKAPGLCGGKGGSMHLTDISVRRLRIVRDRRRAPPDRGRARPSRASIYAAPRTYACASSATESTNIGAFHEAMNLAVDLEAAGDLRL